jgi:hypothetical protein
VPGPTKQLRGAMSVSVEQVVDLAAENLGDAFGDSHAGASAFQLVPGDAADADARPECELLARHPYGFAGLAESLIRRHTQTLMRKILHVKVYAPILLRIPVRTP